MSERFKMPVFTAVILKKGDEVCLLRRANAKLHDGFYAIAGGGVDGGESVIQATIREAQEELGVNLDLKNLSMVHVLHVRTEIGNEYINFFMEVSAWSGEPSIMEPEKCNDVSWFSLARLPEKIMPMHKHVFEMIAAGVLYSEYGWPVVDQVAEKIMDRYADVFKKLAK